MEPIRKNKRQYSPKLDAANPHENIPIRKDGGRKRRYSCLAASGPGQLAITEGNFNNQVNHLDFIFFAAVPT